MFEVFVGVATIASGIAAVVMMVLAVADRVKRPSKEKNNPK
jgi:hypothetical protein